MLNLFNTAVLAEQSTFGVCCSQIAAAGCDDLLKERYIGPPLFPWDITEMVHTEFAGTSSVPQYWKATFPQATSIKTIAIMNRDDCCSFRIQQCIVTIGNNADVTLNPTCVALGTMPDGGWYLCATSMTGTTFGLYSTTSDFNFMEAMAYSQEAIQMNAGVTVSFLGANDPSYPVSNALQKIVVLMYTDAIRQKCVSISPPAAGLATFSVKLKAYILINGVTVLPGYQTTAEWHSIETNVAIFGMKAGGNQHLCGVLADFYALYSEASCVIQANEIIVQQQTIGIDLSFCGFGALADCDCNTSSFNPSLQTMVTQIFASTVFLNIKSTDSFQTITFNTQTFPDTVSSVCGTADGFSKCGPRIVFFVDKITGLPILVWPYSGYSWNAVTSVLTLNPAQAPPLCVLTAIIKLVDYPTVFYPQDIISIVEQPALVQSGPALPQSSVTALTQAYPPIIPTQTLTATINKEANQQLPILDASQSYVVTSMQTFGVSVAGNQLKVLSTNEADVGTQYLDLAAVNSTYKVPFKVKVIFQKLFHNKQNSNSSVLDSAANMTQNDSLSSDLDRVKCNDQAECVDPTNSRFSCQFDEVSGQVVCGQDLVKTNSSEANSITQPPTMDVSEFSNSALLLLTFSEEIDLSSLFNTTYRRLKGKSRSSQAPFNLADFDQKKYLLSSQHLSITIQPSSDQDISKLKFEWFAVDITETEILIQVLFQNPLFISNYAPLNPEFLIIRLRPALLVILKSQQTQMTIFNPLQTYQRRVPKQLVLGTLTDSVGAAAENSKEVAEALIIGNFVMSYSLNGIMGAMYTMVNTFQMLMTLCYISVLMPANVVLVMTQINTIASFDYLPTEWMLKFCFDFTKTEMPFVSFQDMDVKSMRLITFMGTFMIVIFLICFQSFLFVISWPFKKVCKLALRFHNMMKQNYYWNGILRLFVESYYDLCVAILISFREPRFDRPSDIFDFCLTVFFALVVITGPIISYLLMRKYSQELSEEKFQLLYGSLTEGYHTTGALGSENTRNMIIWFFMRRNLTALAVVQLGDQSPVFQITAIMYISLADLLINIRLNAYESKMSGIMAKVNDLIVFLLSYFPFLYAGGFVSDPELVYQIGWIQCVLVAIMFVANMTVLIISTISNMMEECRRIRVEQFNLRILRDYGFVMVIVVESGWQTMARSLTIEWAFFDGIPARLSVQIAQYVEIFQIRQAAQVAGEADQLELEFGADANAEKNTRAKQLAQEISDFSFGSDIETPVVKSARPKEYDTEPSEFDENGDETQEHKDWEQSMLRPHGLSSVAKVSSNKISSTQNQYANNKVVPDKQVGQKSAPLFQRKRKRIVEDTEELKDDKESKLNKLKAKVFDTVLKSLVAERDPIAANVFRNIAAQQVSYLLPNDISQMSDNGWKDLKDEVRTIIAASEEIPDLNQSAEINLNYKMPPDSTDINESQLFPHTSPRQKKRVFYYHKARVENINKMQAQLHSDIQSKTADYNELRNISRNADQYAETAPQHQKVAAKVNAKHIKEVVRHQQKQILKDVKVEDSLTADKAYHRAQINRISKSLERRM